MLQADSVKMLPNLLLLESIIAQEVLDLLVSPLIIIAEQSIKYPKLCRLVLSFLIFLFLDIQVSLVKNMPQCTLLLLK